MADTDSVSGNETDKEQEFSRFKLFAMRNFDNLRVKSVDCNQW